MHLLPPPRARSPRATALATLLVAALVPAVARAATRSVGPGQSYPTATAAAAAAGDGDVIEIHPGTYREEVVWTRNRLTIRAVGGRVVFDRTGMPLVLQGGKGIFVIDGADTTIEGIEFVGAHVASTRPNGAGIRWEGGGSLTVRGCVFRDNENGILGGNHANNTAVIETSEFVGNGRGDVGYTHSVYFGEIDTVTFRGNWSHALWGGGADVGHLFKSRARRNFVLYNRLTAESAPSSYEVNIPPGGEAYVIGNLIQQRAGSQRTMLSFGDGDGTQYTASRLFVANNTFVNESSGAATFVRTTQPSAQLRLVNNLFVGAGTASVGGAATASNNVATSMPRLLDQPGYDYHLTAGSPAIDAGIDLGASTTVPLVPTAQYVHPRAIAARVAVGAIDVGAYEFAGTTGGTDAGPGADAGRPLDAGAGTDAGTIARDAAVDSDGESATTDAAPPIDAATPRRDASVTDGATGGAMDGGCGCRVPGRVPVPRSAAGLGAVALAALGASATRRKRGAFTPRGSPRA